MRAAILSTGFRRGGLAQTEYAPGTLREKVFGSFSF
ncbi:hypothetical protein QFZ79_000782 [Arthrobacter sp. V4I6]|nr:hypothetical protein [Arthrobacter sp. V4I6]